MSQDPLIKLRPWAVEPFWRRDLGIQVWSWGRRSGKSFSMAARAMEENMRVPGNTNTYISASVKIGGEFLRKEAVVWQLLIENFRKAVAANKQKLETTIDGLAIDDICEVFEQQKLECKIWHTNTIYSRSLVVAANPDTAVGYGANLFVDEFGRIPDFQDVFEAITPFMDENPDLFCIMASTPPPDDAHYSYEMTAPPPGAEFKVNPKGNWYTSSMGFPVHRVTADDRYAAGFPMYHPITRKPVTPDEHREASPDRTAWDRNNRCAYIQGGTSACSLYALAQAMERGRELGIDVDITDQLEVA